MEAIKTEKLTRKFGPLTAVNQLDLTVNKGEIFGLVGPDGAGKTTTMRLLTGILDPTEGEAWVNGLHTVKEAEPIKNKIGYMSQRFGLYPDLTVLENILFYADIYEIPKKERQEKIDTLLGFSNLTPFKDRLADKLSGGMKQKLGLACALIHKPDILFLDEPTNGVDPVSRRDFWRILYQLHDEGVTIFISTAYMDEAERCGRLGFLHEGELLACGTSDTIKELHQGKIVEISIASPKDVLPKLKEEYGRQSVRLFGSRIHIAVEDEVESIKDFLNRSGFQNHTIHSANPSLEDVFISILTKKEQGEANV